MVRRLIIFALLLASCARQNDRSRPPAPTPDEVARSRGSTAPDEIDSLLAKILAMDAEFGAAETKDVPAFFYSGRNDSAFKRLAVIPAAVPRLVDCLGWDRRSRSMWEGAPVLVGAVCGHVLRVTPYAQSRRPSNPWDVAADKHFLDAASPQWLYCACS